MTSTSPEPPSPSAGTTPVPADRSATAPTPGAPALARARWSRRCTALAVGLLAGILVLGAADSVAGAVDRAGGPVVEGDATRPEVPDEAVAADHDSVRPVVEGAAAHLAGHGASRLELTATDVGLAAPGRGAHARRGPPGG